MHLGRRLLAGGIAVASALGALSATAGEFPERAMTIVVPFAPGGSIDVIARLLGKGMSDRLGQPVVIENKSGAAGVTGADFAAKASPDGYTMVLATSSSIAIMPHLMAKLPFDPRTDLEPITLVARVQELLVTHAGSGIASARELAAGAKAEPGKLTYGSAGVGGITHLAGELFKREAGIDMVHVPYRGSAPAVVDLLAGRITASILDNTAFLQHVRAGTLKPLMVPSQTRLALLPDVPTASEAGFPSVLSDNWNALDVAASVPADVRAKLHAAATAALRSKDVADAIAAQGGTASPSTRAELATFAAGERARWETVVRSANVKLE